MVRNKLLFFGVGLIALLLVLSLIIVSASLAREWQARREADVALRQAETDKAEAQTEAVKSQQVTQFLENMLNGVGPAVARGQDTKMLRGILDQTAKSVGEEMTDQPAVEAELRTLIGRLYLEIGNYGHDRYAACIRELLEDWIAANPYAWSVNWACAMEPALRILCWTWLFHACNAAPSWQDEGFQATFLRALHLHGEFTERNLEHSDINGNHYTTDAAGLVTAGLFFGKGEAASVGPHWAGAF